MSANNPSPSASNNPGVESARAQMPTSAVVGKLPHRRARGRESWVALVASGTPEGTLTGRALGFLPTMRATLVIPTLNEAASIAHVLRLFRDAATEANSTQFKG